MMKKGLLKQLCLKVIFVLIAFFSLNINVNASSFSYDSFDWDTFYKENINYWTDYCSMYSDDVSMDDCIDVTLSGKRNYYENLYRLLAKYEKSYYKLNDNIIIATTFFALTPDTFSDYPENYLEEYKTGSAYGLSDVYSYEVNKELNEQDEQEYLDEESDTLKTLTRHMFGYSASCNDLNGNKIESYALNYSEYMRAKFNFIGKYVGLVDEYRKKCEDQGGSYQPPTGEKQINYDVYWKFLEESEYLDEKVHLKSYYYDVLEETGHNLMSELNDTEKEEYKEDIIDARKDIVSEIKSIIDTYGEVESPDSFINTGCNSSYWWPIGSNETTEENGKLFARGEPSSINITATFAGNDKTHNGNHGALDIGAPKNVANVIATKGGVVVYPNNSSQIGYGDGFLGSMDGEGYGNFVVIDHQDGTYSLYGHMYANTITVYAGDVVEQGQVIGKVGTSGNSKGSHLHFEIRIGANNSKKRVDPLNYISKDNPRSGGMCGSSSEFTKMLHYFEGGCDAEKNGNNYVVHDDGYNYATVGYGVALIHNIDNFKKYGIDVSAMGIGDEIPIEIVDDVKEIKVNSFRSSVNKYLADHSITLTEYQVDCLTMVSFQFGNIGNFGEMFKKYGNSDALRENTTTQSGKWYYFKENPSTANGRAEATWKLFHEGVYTYDKNKC